jgi:3-oxoacyl-[acyl-carrier-protein] synthase II
MTDRTAVVVTGYAVVSAAGRGGDALWSALSGGTPLFAPVTRFDVSARRARYAATLPGTPDLLAELVEVLDGACVAAGLGADARTATPLLLATRPDYALARMPAADRPQWSGGALAALLADKCGLGPAVRTYTSACVSGSTALADAAAGIAAGRYERVAVASGYLVDADHLAFFDAGRALSDDGALRAFSTGRRGFLLGDAVVALVLESAPVAARRGAVTLARIAGWGRAGDAYHVCQPEPSGDGLARAIRAALQRSGLYAEEIGYVNAHGTGTPYSDAAECAALRATVPGTPVSSTKTVHGHTLDASGPLELVATILALRAGTLPANAGYRGPDPDCAVDLVLDRPQRTDARYALCVNSAFGGANTALVVGAP